MSQEVQPNPYSVPPQVVLQPQPTNTAGLVGFILSLTGLLAPCMFPVGMIVSCFGLKKEPKGLAIAGLVIGAVGTLILLAVLIIYGAIIAACVGVAATVQPVIETQAAVQEASGKIDEYQMENQELPDEATGNSLISGITDGWENSLRYELDEEALDGYVVRSAGPDGVFDTGDDSTSEDPVFDEDWEEYEIDESGWDESDFDETELDESEVDESSWEIELEEGGTETLDVSEPAVE